MAEQDQIIFGTGAFFENLLFVMHLYLVLTTTALALSPALPNQSSLYPAGMACLFVTILIGIVTWTAALDADVSGITTIHTQPDALH